MPNRGGEGGIGEVAKEVLKAHELAVRALDALGQQCPQGQEMVTTSHAPRTMIPIRMTRSSRLRRWRTATRRWATSAVATVTDLASSPATMTL